MELRAQIFYLNLLISCFLEIINQRLHCFELSFQIGGCYKSSVPGFGIWKYVLSLCFVSGLFCR